MDTESSLSDESYFGQEGHENSIEDLDASKEAIEAVENCLSEQLKKLANFDGDEEEPAFEYPNPSSWNNVELSETLGLVPTTNDYEIDYVKISYVNANTRKKYSRILLILDKIHMLLTDKESVTLRELYYQLVGQDGGRITQIYEAVGAISIILGLPRGRLQIFATSKGLVAGNLKFTNSEEVQVDCSLSAQGETIPNNVDAMVNIITEATMVIVVEKDAIFQKLLEEEFLKHLPFRAILITGKGYPDLNTRKLLRKLAFEIVPQATFVCLVDGNPYGMEIMSVYKFGSLSMVWCGEPLAVPKLEWIGVLPSEFVNIDNARLQDFSEADANKAQSLMERTYLSLDMQNELAFMTNCGKKAEIEDVASPSAYLMSKLFQPFDV